MSRHRCVGNGEWGGPAAFYNCIVSSSEQGRCCKKVSARFLKSVGRFVGTIHAAPPFAALGLKLCQVGLNCTPRGRPPYI